MTFIPESSRDNEAKPSAAICWRKPKCSMRTRWTRPRPRRSGTRRTRRSSSVGAPPRPGRPRVGRAAGEVATHPHRCTATARKLAEDWTRAGRRGPSRSPIALVFRCQMSGRAVHGCARRPGGRPPQRLSEGAHDRRTCRCLTTSPLTRCGATCAGPAVATAGWKGGRSSRHQTRGRRWSRRGVGETLGEGEPGHRVLDPKRGRQAPGGSAQHSQVPARGRTADGELVGEVAGGHLSVPQQLHDAASGRIRKRQGPPRHHA